MSARWLAIANPQAGAFRTGHFETHWMPRVREHVAAVVYTQGPRDATAIARAACNYDGIAAIGGDGTLLEVLAGITLGGPSLAIIPAGRGNCMALDLGVDTVPRALQAIANGSAFDIDLMAIDATFADGRRDTYHAASTVAVGYVADAVRRAEQFAVLGRYAYAAATVVTRPRFFMLETCVGDGSPSRRRLSGIIINNSRHLANFLAFPRASLSDRRIDMLELNVGWTAQMLHNVALLSRSYFYNPGKESQAEEFHVRLLAPDWLMIDGELIDGVAKFSVRCDPAALRVIRGLSA